MIKEKILERCMYMTETLALPPIYINCHRFSTDSSTININSWEYPSFSGLYNLSMNHNHSHDICALQFRRI